MGESEPAPPLTDAARAVLDAARGVAGAWGGHFRALRELLLADFALAREALLRTLLLLVLAAIVFGTCWALLIGLCVWGLHASGMSWGWALGLPLGVGMLVGTFALLQALKAIRFASMDASREQLRTLLERTDAASAADEKSP